MEYIKFIFFLIFLLILPGYVLTSPLRFPLGSKERYVSSFAAGVIFFTALTVVLYFLKVPALVLPVIIFFNIFFFVKLFKEYQKTKKSEQKNERSLIANAILCLLLILGTIFFNPWVIRSNFITPEKNIITIRQLDRDDYWHLAIQNEIQKRFPPAYPGFSGAILKNYHYLSDVLISSFIRISKINNFNTFLYFFPLFLSLQFGFSIYTLIKTISKNTFAALFSTAFSYFSGNASYLLPLIDRQMPGWKESTFMLDQPNLLGNNMHTLFGIILVLGALVIYSSTQIRFKVILMSILIGVSAGFKIYPAMVLVSAIAVVSLIRLLFKKEKELIFVTLGSLFFSILTIAPNLEGSNNAFLWTPGWILRRMVEDPDRVNWSQLVLLEQTYRLHNNWPRLLEISVIELMLYFLGNLSVRIVGLFVGLSEILKKNGDKVVAIMGASVCISLIIPLFISQRTTMYNTLQFGSLAIILSSILTPLILKKEPKTYQIGVMLTFLILAIPVQLRGFIESLNSKPAAVETSFLEAMKPLSVVSRNETVLLYLSSSNIRNLAVSGISGTQTFFSGEEYAQLGGNQTEVRKKAIEKFFSLPNNEESKIYQSNFLKINNIKTLFLRKEEENMIKQIYISYTMVFENSSGKIFHFNI